jgi:hypothetical protein
VLVHSDRGRQYTSADYQAVLASAEVVVSFRRKGNGWDNAPTEAFLARLKKGLWDRRSFADETDAERAVFEDIEVFYNRERLHSSLYYVSPATFEARQPAHTVNSPWGIPNRLPRVAVADPTPQAAGRGVDVPAAGGPPAGVEAEDRGGTRDREDEGVADRGRPIPEPAAVPRGHDEERGRIA